MGGRDLSNVMLSGSIKLIKDAFGVLAVTEENKLFSLGFGCSLMPNMVNESRCKIFAVRSAMQEPFGQWPQVLKLRRLFESIF